MFFFLLSKGKDSQMKSLITSHQNRNPRDQAHNHKEQIMHEQEGQTEERSVRDPRPTMRIDRSGTSRVWVPLACLLGVALFVVGYISVNQKKDDAATIASLKATSNQQAAELKKINDVREAAAKAEEAKRAAAAARPVMSGSAVLAQTLFEKGQFPISKEKVGSAAKECQVNGETPSLCMVRLWSKLHKRYATEVIVVTKSGMDENQAKDLAACLGQKLPKHDDGTSDDPAPVNLSGNKYKGQRCLEQEGAVATQ